MPENHKKLMENLVKLSEVDAGIARLIAERRQFEEELSESRKVYNEKKAAYTAKAAETAEIKKRGARDEKYLKGEREKLVARRKALSSLGDYKTQQMATREIDTISKQLDRREEEVLQVLLKVDELSAEVEKLAEEFEKAREEYEKLESAAQERFSGIENRQSEKVKIREDLVKLIDEDVLSKYEHILERYPADPLVAFENNNCKGCYVQLSPQVIVKIARGMSMQTCPGCGRILVTPQEKGS